MAYKIVNMWVPSSKYRIKAPYAMKPNYLVIHNTANTASARNEVAYMRRNNNMTSFHVAVDDKEVVQAVPFNRNSWHTGDGSHINSGNRKAIGLEICYSMDNGYSGAYSARHRKAENNAALYAAHVLKQYGWGTDRLRQHYNYTKKDCPHKMRAHNGWNAFKKNVQSHLDALNGKESESAVKPNPAPKPSGTSYTVKSGDALWGISKASGVSVANLKSFNGLNSNTIIVGQELNLKKTSNSSEKKTPYTVGDWKKNTSNGAQYIEAHGTFTVTADKGVYARFDNPSTKSPSGGLAEKGWSHKYQYLVRANGYVWIQYEQNGRQKFLPYNDWNSKTGAVGKTPYGTFS